jgi:hypothetical protein
MDEQEADRVSQELGIQTPGIVTSLAGKRRNLTAHIGLKAQCA